MATRRQPLNLRGLLPGLFAATLLCAVALAAFLALWFSAPGTGWQTVRCESTNNRQRSCPVGWNGPSRLTRQLSGSACIEGRTWRSERGAGNFKGPC